MPDNDKSNKTNEEPRKIRLNEVPTKTVRLDTVVEDPNNPNRMTARQMEALERVVDRYGYANDVWVRANTDGTYTVIDGEHRIRLLRKRGVRSARCRVFATDLTDADVAILRQAANKLRGQHDVGKDADEFLRVHRAGRLGDLARALARDEEHLQAVLEKRFDMYFDRPEPVFSKAPPPKKKGTSSSSSSSPANAKKKAPEKKEAETRVEAELPPPHDVLPGDIWSLGGRHFVLCGDCTIRDDIAELRRQFGPEKGIAQILTDPPYGVAYAPDKKPTRSGTGGGRAGMNDIRRIADRTEDAAPRPIVNDRLAPVQIRALMRAAVRAAPLQQTNTIYVFGVLPQLSDAIDGLRDAGCTITTGLVWLKHSVVVNQMDYNARSELIAYGWKGRHKFYGVPQADDVLDFERPQKSPWHPTSKPVPLLARLVRDGTKKGSIVYDPFAGGGSTIIACEDAGRRCMAVEVEPVYVQAAIQRWEAHARRGGEKTVEAVLVHRAPGLAPPTTTTTTKRQPGGKAKGVRRTPHIAAQKRRP